MNRVTIAIILSLFSLIGCKTLPETSNHEKNRDLRWASIDPYKIQQLIGDNIAANVKLPNELIFDERKNNIKIKELEIYMQELKTAAIEMCDKELIPPHIKKPIAAIPIPPVGISSDGVSYHNQEWDRYFYLTSRAEYVSCMNKELNGPETIKIKSELAKKNNLRKRRLERLTPFHEDIQRILQHHISDYAKENQLDLIVLRMPNAIIYKKNSQSVDITEKFETYIKTKLVHAK